MHSCTACDSVSEFTLLEIFLSVGRHQALRNDLLSYQFGRGVRDCLCLYCVKVRRMIVIEHYNTVSWIQTIERDISCLFLLADTLKTLARLLIFRRAHFPKPHVNDIVRSSCP